MTASYAYSKGLTNARAPQNSANLAAEYSHTDFLTVHIVWSTEASCIRCRSSGTRGACRSRSRRVRTGRHQRDSEQDNIDRDDLGGRSGRSWPTMVGPGAGTAGLSGQSE